MNLKKLLWPALIILLLSSGSLLKYFGITEDTTWILNPPASPETSNSFLSLASVPDIISESDISLYYGLGYQGKEERWLYNWTDGWTMTEVYVFKVYFSDDSEIEFRVNPTLGTRLQSRNQVERFGRLIGQLAKALRESLRFVAINPGDENLGGAQGHISIYTERADRYLESNSLEEVLIHEGAHASLDSTHRASAAWINAQKADSLFISNYANEHPGREDLAESFIYYQAIRYRPEKISEETKAAILARIPNRIAFFDSLNLNMYPVESEKSIYQ